MKQKYAYQLLVKEYLSKCKCCDECVAEGFCIRNQYKRGREPNKDCPKFLAEYFRKLLIS